MQKKIRIVKLVICILSVFHVLTFLGFECLHAQNFPTKSITIVVPTPPGSQTDLLNRALAPFAAEYFNGHSFVINYRDGGAGAIGSNEVAQAQPDGYTILLGNANPQSVLVAATGRGKGPDDLSAICRLTNSIGVYWVQPDAPWKTFPELITWAKANPGKLVNGIPTAWSAQDFTWKWLEMKAGFTSRIVPTGGGNESLVSLLGGHIQISRIAFAQSSVHYRAGKLRPLAVSGSERRKELPDVPTLAELGYDMGDMGENWIGYFAPKATPRPIIDRLNEGFKKIVQDKRAIANVEKSGIEFAYLGPDDLTKIWRAEYNTYVELFKKFKK